MTRSLLDQPGTTRSDPPAAQVRLCGGTRLFYGRENVAPKEKAVWQQGQGMDYTAGILSTHSNFKWRKAPGWFTGEIQTGCRICVGQIGRGVTAGIWAPLIRRIFADWVQLPPALTGRISAKTWAIRFYWRNSLRSEQLGILKFMWSVEGKKSGENISLTLISLSPSVVYICARY